LIGTGQSIGNYRILSKIGTGGMGAVYLAEHPLIGKKVALKVIHRELSGNKEVVQRFYQEARAVNQIGNEHIVEIHDFGQTQEGDHFYIMEYLEGRTLAQVLTQEKVLAVMRALHIGAQIANALAAAHAQGIIHRDLKPDNIMLMPRLGDPDFVKVLDFGLAKMLAGGGPQVRTAVGVVLGTPQYMSPEACESKPNVDYRTDIYALGVLMFQMMTGVLPFDGQSMGEVLVKQVTALPPAPRGINPGIPPSVEQILLRCLAKPVDARFQSMQQLREALLDPEAYLRGSPPIAPARSVQPGDAPVDAKTVIAHAAAAHQQKTRIAGPAAMAAAAAQQPQPWQVAPAVMAEPPRTGALPIPGLAPSAPPANNTMRIATPLGYSSRPPRKMWPIVLVLGLLLGLGGGAFAVAWFGRDAEQPAPDAATVATPPPVDAHVAVVVDAAAPPPAADAAVAVDAGKPMAKLTIDSTPHGATVTGPDGSVLGKTPLKIDWPVGERAQEFELKLAGYKKKIADVVVKGNTAVGVELEKQHSSGGTQKPGKGSGGSGAGSDLIKPGD
jgi:eukaryotic-like serine/threonine-protein kinase